MYKRIKYVIFLTIVLSGILPTKPAFAEYKIDYNATVAFEHLSFLLNRPDYTINEQETLNLDFGFVYDNYKNFYINLHPRLRIDFRDYSRNRYLPNEAYLKFYNDYLEVNGGFQLRTWGVSNSFNPSDVLNRKDLEDNYYVPDKLGDVMVGFKAVIPNLGFMSDLTFEIIGFPYFQPTPLPENDTRFALQGNVGGVSFTRSDEQEYPELKNSFGGAASISATIKSSDISLHYYHGLEREAGFYLALDESANLRLTPFYYTIDMVGMNTETSIGKFIFHTESAFKITRANEPRFHELPLLSSSDVIPNDYFQFVVGLDFILNNVFGGDLTLTLEYLGEDDHEIILEEFRPFKNDVFFGLQYQLNNTRLTQFQVGVIKDLDSQEMITQFAASTKIVKELKLSIEGVIVNQSDNADLALSFIENNTYVLGSLSYTFGGSHKNSRKKSNKSK
jgi:hypothetical protein